MGIPVFFNNFTTADVTSALSGHPLKTIEKYTRHNTGESLLLQDCKKSSISMLFQNFCLEWKLSTITNR